MKNLNIIRKSFIAAFATFVALTMALTGCDQPYEMDLPLAVTSRDLQLEKTAGSTHVLVYSDGEWTARLTRPVKWASIDRQSGFGNHEIVFSYSANYGISRKIGVIFQKGALADTVVFTQAGSLSEAQLSFKSTAATLVRSAAEVYIPISTNLQYALGDIEAEIVYYDENGLANEPVAVEMTREDGELDGEEGEEGEGEGEGEGEIIPEEPVVLPVDPWISGLHLTKSGLAFKVTTNEGLFARTAEVKLKIADAAGVEVATTCSILQGVADPMFSLEAAAGQYSGLSQTVFVASTENNLSAYAPYFEKEVVYEVPVEEGMEWVKSISITAEGLQFNLTANEGETPRKATVNVSYTDAEGNSISASYAVTQAIYPKVTEFAAVRAMTPGELKVAGFIEGYIVGDYASANIDSAPQTKQFWFDRTELPKVNYIQSLDGKYGFKLKFDSASDNNIARFSKVKIALEGLTLVKNNDPEYYILTGVTATNILEVGAVDEFRAVTKKKTIAELNDDDIFTACIVKGLEIMCKDGAYTNVTDGYVYKDGVTCMAGSTSSPRTDMAPLLMYDRQGNSISMLTNIGTTWRRDKGDVEFYTVVPQGSGDFKAIVVADDLIKVKYGDIGRYQLRAMSEEDIALDAEEAFTKTIVEWNWNDSTNDLTPEIGTGTINKHGATHEASVDFNNTYLTKGDKTELTGKGGAPYNGSKEQKGQVVNGGIRMYPSAGWWDFTNNVGRYFDVEFSTAGLSGDNIVFGMVWWTGALGNSVIFAPQDWKILYSIDGGTTFNEIAKNPGVELRAQTWWTTSPNDCAPGGYEMMRNIPADAFGKEKVVIRVQAASKVCAKAVAPNAENYQTLLCQRQDILTSSKAGSAQKVGFGTITVRYN